MFGLVIGPYSRRRVGERARQLSEGRAGVEMAAVHRAGRRLRPGEPAVGHKDETARRLMTMPSVGPIVALASTTYRRSARSHEDGSLEARDRRAEEARPPV